MQINLTLVIIGVVLLILIIGLISTYNGLVRARNKVKDQWSQIDVQLKRRFDLIPNLVETVKGYAKHEQSTLQAVMEARNAAVRAASPADEIRANNELTGVLGKLMAVAENYPDLKANTQFTELQKALRETEDKIAYARQFYNDTVYMYKNKTQTFPANIVASMFGFKAEEFISIADNERQNVAVSF